MSRYELRVRTRFEAAHHLTAYRGAPEPSHGHSWTVEAIVSAPALNDEGYAVDFVLVRDALLRLSARFDHRDLNTIPPFDRSSPTAEHLAEWFCGELQESLPGVDVRGVTVWEGPDCSATFLR